MAKLRGRHLSKEQRLEEIKNYANEMYKIRIQKALEELKKERYCKQCGSNDEHSISCNSITRGYVYDEKDVNEFINSETSRNTDYSKMIKK